MRARGVSFISVPFAFDREHAAYTYTLGGHAHARLAGIIRDDHQRRTGRQEVATVVPPTIAAVPKGENS